MYNTQRNVSQGCIGMSNSIRKEEREIPRFIPAIDGEWSEKTFTLHSIIYRVLVKRNNTTDYILMLHQAIVDGDYRATPLYIFQGITSAGLVVEMIQLFSCRRN